MMRGERLVIPSVWIEAIDEYEKYLLKSRAAQSSQFAYRFQPASAFARAHCNTSPQEVTLQNLQEYLAGPSWNEANLCRQRMGVHHFFVWLHRVGRILENPAESLIRKPPVELPPMSWRASLRMFAAWLQEQGRSSRTIADYLGHVERFARRPMDKGPWKVTADCVATYLEDGMSREWTPRTIDTVRNRLELFYTWAVSTGWTKINPCTPLSKRLKKRDFPPQWDRAVSRWATHLRGQQYTEATISKSLGYLNDFAWTARCSPWTVSIDQTDQWLGRNTRSEASADRAAAILRSFYGWARDHKYIKALPLRGSVRKNTERPFPKLWQEPASNFMTYLESQKLTEGTRRTRRFQLRALAEHFDGQDPWKMTAADLTSYLANPDWSQETTKAAKSSITGFYTWAERFGMVDKSPARYLAAVRIPRALPRPINESALREALVRTVDTPREHLMLTLARYAGLRAAEIASLHTKDVEIILLENGTWTGRLNIVGKGGRHRVIPLVPDVAELLHSYTASTRQGFIFPNHNNAHIRADTVSRVMAKSLQGAGTAHTLRHRFGTNAYAFTQDLRATQELLGHASPTTTARYTAVANRSMLAAVMAAAGDLDLDPEHSEIA